MRHSVFAACFLVIIALIYRSFPTSVDTQIPNSKRPDETTSAGKSENLQGDEDLSRLKFTPGEDAATKDSTVPADFPGQFEQLHIETVESFGQAMGFGVSRGGAHILSNDETVKFIDDVPRRVGEGDRDFGLWGSLGTRANRDVNSQQHATAESTNKDLSAESPPVIRTEQTYSPHQFRTGDGFMTFAPQTGAESQYPFVLKTIDLISTESEFVHMLQTPAATAKLSPTRNASSRAFTPFEAEAVKRLIAGSNAVFDRNANHVTAIGAIRSRGKCNACHRTKTDDLLGAFLYQFTLTATE